MTDSELLKNAAKAARIEWADGHESTGLRNANGTFWNPLADSGQALELAVKRKILRCHMDLFHRFYEEEIASGRSEADATRRAIVRAVAEIGKNL